MQSIPPIVATRPYAFADDPEVLTESLADTDVAGVSPFPLLAEAVPAGANVPQRIAVLVRDGVHRAQVDGLLKLLDLRGHDIRVLAERLGSVVCSDGSRLEVDASLRRWPAWYFDSVVRLSGMEQGNGRLSAAEADFLQARTDEEAVPLTCLPWPVTARAPTH